MDRLPLPPLTRTIAALEAYDRFDGATDWDTPDTEKWFNAYLHLESLGKAVGAAFGEDTKDRNNPKTCEAVIRPGPKVPGPGFELSFVRRMCARSLN